MKHLKLMIREEWFKELDLFTLGKLRGQINKFLNMQKPKAIVNCPLCP